VCVYLWEKIKPLYKRSIWFFKVKGALQQFQLLLSHECCLGKSCVEKCSDMMMSWKTSSPCRWDEWRAKVIFAEGKTLRSSSQFSNLAPFFSNFVWALITYSVLLHMWCSCNLHVVLMWLSRESTCVDLMPRQSFKRDYGCSAHDYGADSAINLSSWWSHYNGFVYISTKKNSSMALEEWTVYKDSTKPSLLSLAH